MFRVRYELNFLILFGRNADSHMREYFLWGTNWILLYCLEEMQTLTWECFLWGTNWIFLYCLEEMQSLTWVFPVRYELNFLILFVRNAESHMRECFLWGTNWIFLYCLQEMQSLTWESKVWLRVLRDSDHWVVALQTGDPSSHQRGLPTWRRQKSNYQT
jgi:hypothetical protein